MLAKSKSLLIAISKTKEASLGLLRNAKCCGCDQLIVQAGSAPINPDSPALNHPDSKGGYESSLASFLEVRVVR